MDSEAINALAILEFDIGFHDDDILIALGGRRDPAQDGPDVLRRVVERIVILFEDSKRSLGNAHALQIEVRAKNGRNLAKHQVVDTPSVYWKLAVFIIENGEPRFRHAERVADGRDDADAFAD